MEGNPGKEATLSASAASTLDAVRKPYTPNPKLLTLHPKP